MVVKSMNSCLVLRRRSLHGRTQVACIEPLRCPLRRRLTWEMVGECLWNDRVIRTRRSVGTEDEVGMNVIVMRSQSEQTTAAE